MYAAQQEAQGAEGAPNPEGATESAEDEVTDVDFEEVNEEKK
jgi:hypothetical protein